MMPCSTLLPSLSIPLSLKMHTVLRERPAAERDLTVTNLEEVGGGGSWEGKKQCCVGVVFVSDTEKGWRTPESKG